MNPPNEKELPSHRGDADCSEERAVGASPPAAPAPQPSTEEEIAPSWFDLGGLATSLAQSARQYIPPAIEGVASAIHQSALNVAAELAEMERMEAGDVLESQARRQHSLGSSSACDDESGHGAPINLLLPWQVEVKGTGNATTGTGKDDEELKEKIMALSQDEITFQGPYNESNDNATEQYLEDQSRVALIARLLVLDPNLAEIHAKRHASGRSERSETYFWKNYFYHCDRIRADQLVHDDELDVELVLQTPPPSPESRQRERIIVPSPPKVLSVDDLVLVNMEGEDDKNDV
mmetsp:Transcript_8119/g.17566  ORF Transcript_8119/g.17566 Transcript_8119/m.17566 type:complete len:292 (-) Transcript_8119:211-1086(-)|eukprot:CAMPEP_0178509178 /NCGR_PEP_ID=MMETSP0696-20121128/21150_1 /TAXON_ID=265572 /ORGANISM="Extubocellulus spinifer, Strain CCMP396" /LENGTH=291 /DNA_ID=CAMNT_0020138787 /DNA_START=333 /DNA_END=1208 /DNA_ORIENTATION=+